MSRRQTIKNNLENNLLGNASVFLQESRAIRVSVNKQTFKTTHNGLHLDSIKIL